MPSHPTDTTPLATALVGLCGAALCGGAIAAFLFGPQENITELVGLLLLGAAVTGLWMAASATRAVVRLLAIDRPGPCEPRPVEPGRSPAEDG